MALRSLGRTATGGSYDYSYTIEPEGPLTGLPPHIETVKHKVRVDDPREHKPLKKSKAERPRQAGIQGNIVNFHPLHFSTQLFLAQPGSAALAAKVCRRVLHACAGKKRQPSARKVIVLSGCRTSAWRSACADIGCALHRVVPPHPPTPTHPRPAA